MQHIRVIGRKTLSFNKISSRSATALSQSSMKFDAPFNQKANENFLSSLNLVHSCVMNMYYKTQLHYTSKDTVRRNRKVVPQNQSKSRPLGQAGINFVEKNWK